MYFDPEILFSKKCKKFVKKYKICDKIMKNLRKYKKTDELTENLKINDLWLRNFIFVKI